MKLRRIHWMGIIAAIVGIVLDVVFFLNVFGIESMEANMSMFWFVAGICVMIGFLPFIIGAATETERDKEKEEMFLEFSRNLVESVRSGTPISKSIINVSNKDYGSLSPHVRKMANQIGLGLPVKDSLKIFANDLRNPVIGRAIDLMIEAEKAGGDIETILESVAKSVSEIENLKKQRTSAIYNLVVQGYIIFIIFIVIMLVMEFKIIPIVTGITGQMEGSYFAGSVGTNITAIDAEALSMPFLILLVTEGIFSGLIIGAISEGNIKSGLKHSFILTVLAVLISTGARVLFG